MSNTPGYLKRTKSSQLKDLAAATEEKDKEKKKDIIERSERSKSSPGKSTIPRKPSISNTKKPTSPTARRMSATATPTAPVFTPPPPPASKPPAVPQKEPPPSVVGTDATSTAPKNSPLPKG